MLPFPVNSVLKTLPTYQPGRPIDEVARELGLPAEQIIKLASNENSLGPSRLGLAAMRKALSQMHLYPDGGHGYGLRPSSHTVSTWPARAEEWFRARGLLAVRPAP